MTRPLPETVEIGSQVRPNAIAIGDGEAIGGEQPLSHGKASSMATEEPMRSQTIEGDWLYFNPNALWATSRPEAFQNYLRIWRDPEGKYSATLNGPGNFFTIEEFRGMDKEYWLITSDSDRKYIYKAHGKLCGDGLKILEQLTVSNRGEQIARIEATKYRKPSDRFSSNHKQAS
jgi:hypothetical protein